MAPTSLIILYLGMGVSELLLSSCVFLVFVEGGIRLFFLLTTGISAHLPRKVSAYEQFSMFQVMDIYTSKRSNYKP